MRLLKLLPEQVMDYWDDIRTCIEAAVPPHIALDSNSMSYIQEQLLLGTIECWICIDRKLYGVMTTQIVHDPVSRCRNLLIYSVAVVADHPTEIWKLAAEKMRRYAIAKGCNNIIAYSNNERMIKIAEELGADSSYRLLVFKL